MADTPLPIEEDPEELPNTPERDSQEKVDHPWSVTPAEAERDALLDDTFQRTDN